VLRDLPDPFTATRYHSLAVRAEDLPADLEVTARTEGGVIMGLRHRDLPIEGVQFHPESVLTEGGHRLLANWLAGCGDAAAADLVPELAAKLERQRSTIG
jgi:para-aminobenzoate synthetase component 2